MRAKVIQINIEQDSFWLTTFGSGAEECCWIKRQLSRWPDVRIGDEFVVTIQAAKDVPGWPVEKGGDDEC